MKKAGNVLVILLSMLIFTTSYAVAATDGYYQLSEITSAWDGTDANRTKTPTADYDYTYGDEASVTYTLPWSFTFYGTAYNQINVDTNGNIWLGFTGSAHTINLPSTGKGPVISAWNNDLSSYYYGGVFVQHKANPERVVIEWQTETYTEEGYYKPNNFEVVLYQSGTIRANYKGFNASVTKDFASGISKGDGTAYLSLTDTYAPIYQLAGRSFRFNPPQSITVNPLSHSYGTIYVDTTAPSQVTVTNDGAGELTVSSISITGTNSSDFRITNDMCTGRPVAASATCTIDISFEPKLTSGAKVAELVISSDDADAPTTSIALSGTGVYPVFSITKSGTGFGTVTSLPEISCGTTCSNWYPTGSTVSLTATPEAGSQFVGWSGANCSGTGGCTVVLNADAAISAAFELKPVHADFAATSTVGGEPFVVNFTNQSQRAMTWLWDFGDGYTSLNFEPSHVYRTPGAYTVTLTASNGTGSDVAVKTNYITVGACSNPPVKLDVQPPLYFSTLSAAYNVAQDGATIQLQERTLLEGLVVSKSLAIDGGYDCSYTKKLGLTILKGGQIKIDAGTTTLKDVIIDKQ